MAGLLLCALVCLPLSGCLIPQDDQVIDIPPRANRPLRIEDFAPPRASVGFKNGTCANDAFSLTVVDDDLADVIYSYWFIDIDDPNSFPFRPSDVAGGSRARTVTPPNSNSYRSALAGLRPGPHTLTVYVADTSLREYEGDGVIVTESRDTFFPDGGIEYQDRGYRVRHNWQLLVETCQ